MWPGCYIVIIVILLLLINDNTVINSMYIYIYHHHSYSTIREITVTVYEEDATHSVFKGLYYIIQKIFLLNFKGLFESVPVYKWVQFQVRTRFCLLCSLSDSTFFTTRFSVLCFNVATMKWLHGTNAVIFFNSGSDQMCQR